MNICEESYFSCRKGVDEIMQKRAKFSDSYRTDGRKKPEGREYKGRSGGGNKERNDYGNDNRNEERNENKSNIEGENRYKKGKEKGKESRKDDRKEVGRNGTRGNDSKAEDGKHGSKIAVGRIGKVKGSTAEKVRKERGTVEREIESGRTKRDSLVNFQQKKSESEIGQPNRRVSKDVQFKNKRSSNALCPVYKDCGGCSFLHVSYTEQLEKKQQMVKDTLGEFVRAEPIVGMEDPYHYRNKVHAVFDHDRKGNAVSGVYKAGTHEVVPVEECMIEDQKADAIIGSIRGLLKSFKIKTYDEDTGYGLLRHVLVRRGFQSGEIMVVLVTASPILPSKNNFVSALRKLHPDITTIVQNMNDRPTSMVLGQKEKVLFGKGYIEDTLCGLKFRISSKSFYQINPVQTEKLYRKAMEYAELTGTERVFDAYCGIGTIGLTAAKDAKEVIGVELNPDAVRDAAMNAKLNGINNARFFRGDAGEFMRKMADDGEKADVVFMDPPRSGSTEEFIAAVSAVGAKRIVYISCNPETQARDLKLFRMLGYEVKRGGGVDLFPWTGHVETAVLLVRKP